MNDLVFDCELLNRVMDGKEISKADAYEIFEIAKNGFDLSDWDRELVGAILGMYVADRTLAKRGK